MVRGCRAAVAWGLSVAVGFGEIPAALAHAPRSSLDMPARESVPEFRPSTGRIWRPLNVGGSGGTPQDLAFDPLRQVAYVRGVITQRPAVAPSMQYRFTAGGSVPVVNLGGATLGAVPGKRWEVVLYLANNSADPVLPALNCRFTNAGRLVEQTHVLVPMVEPGVRVGVIVYGPRTGLVVERATCAVTSP